MPAPIPRRILALLAAPLSPPPPPSPPPPAAEPKPLKRGSHGVRVKVLQRDLGLSPADGIFGKGTYKAVRRFQRRHHLAVDGIGGTVTWRLAHGSRAHASSRGAGGARVQRR